MNQSKLELVENYIENVTVRNGVGKSLIVYNSKTYLLNYKKLRKTV